ncbi:hypothetical protein M441DRAFT_321798, partial [Trichoderma asperellum CBS 433.97]
MKQQRKKEWPKWINFWRPGRDARRPTRSSDFDRICGWSLCGASPAATALPCLSFGIVPRQIRCWETRPRGRLWREMHGQAAWSVDEERGSREQRWQDRGPRRRGLRMQREHGELTAFWGNTKLRSEATSKALERGILVGVVGQQVELQARMRDKTPRPSAECSSEGVEAAVNGWLAQYYQRLIHRREDKKAKQSKAREEKKRKTKLQGQRGDQGGWILHARPRLAEK